MPQGKFQLDVFFHSESSHILEQPPKKAVKSTSLEIPITQIALGNLMQVDPAFSRVLD